MVNVRRVGEQQAVINIYNIYNLPPPSHNEEREKDILPYLQHALRMPGEYIVIKDFNLYYPL
jgi:hypothetical protein